MKTINNEIKTYFKITGDFNPDDIAKELGLEPTRTWNKGDKRRIAAGTYTFSLCEFCRIEKKNNVFANKQMMETILPLLNKVNILCDLRKKFNLSYVLEIVPKFYSIEDKPILSPPKEVVDFCCLTNTLIDIDYYFYFDVKNKTIFKCDKDEANT